MDRIEIKASIAVDDAGVITGMAWPFGSPDLAGDVIEKGAFASPPRLPMLFAHDQAQAVGVWDGIAENGSGLTVKGRLLVEDVERAREVRALVREGAVTGLSIGFVTKKSAPRTGGGRTITQLDLHEISIVPVPSHPGARVTTIKEARMSTKTIEKKEDAGETQAIEDRVTALEGDVSTLKADVAAIKGTTEEASKSLTRIETKMNRPGGSGPVDAKEAEAIEKKALATLLRTGSDIEIKTAASDNDPAGGYFVLPTVDTSIRNLLTDLSPMRQLAEVVTISTDRYERFYSKGRRGAQWVAEREDRPQDTARPELIKHSYGVAELYAAPAATRHLLDDASVDIASWLINNATHDFDETEGEAFMAGDGIDGSPKGLLTYPTAPEKDFVRAWGSYQYVPVGHASAPTDKQISDALIRLVATLRRPYKSDAVFLMNGNTAIRLRQIVDGNDRYLWAPSGNLIEGVEHPLLGYRVEIDEGMPDIGAGTTPIAFGDFRQGYVVVDRHGVRINRDELTVKGRITFDVYKRVGGGAGDFNAIKFLKIAAS